MCTPNNRHILACLAAGILVGAFLFACGGQPLITREIAAKHDKVLATAKTGYQLMLSDVYHKLEFSELIASGGLLPKTELQVFIDSLVVDTLLGLKADQVVLRDNLNDYRIYRLRYLDELTRTFFDEQLRGQLDIDSQAIANYYQNHPEQFTLPEQVLVHTILIAPFMLTKGKDSLIYLPLSPEERNQKAYEYIMEIRAKITSPELFPEIARQYSHASDASFQYGEVGWVSRGVYLNPFDSIAFSLPIGEVSMPYLDRDGWHLIMITGHIQAGLQPLEGQFYQQARTSAYTERVNTLGGKLMDSLKQLSSIRYHDSLMTGDVFSIEPLVWMAIVNESDTIFTVDLRDLEDSYRDHYRVPNTTPEMKKEMIGQLSLRHIISRAARGLGYDTLPTIRETQAFLLHANEKRVLRRQWFDPPIFPEPTQAEISQYYQAHKADFMTDKPLVAQRIIVPDSATGILVRDKALAGEDFLELAKQYYPGEPKVRAALADVGAVGEADVSPEFWQAARHTIEGKVSYPVKTTNGYEVIKVIKHIPNYDETGAAAIIIPRINQLRIEQFIEAQKQKLFAEYAVQFMKPLPQIQLRPRGERTI